MVQSITLYTADVCPYAQRVEIALEEAGAQYKRFPIDLSNKPEWYAPKVNPASKVPAIAYGGPDVPPDQPSPESTKIAESLILVEFLADLFPDSGILPKDPVERAKARFFIEAVSAKFTSAWYNFVGKGGSSDELFNAIEALQHLLPENGKYALGDSFSAADIAVAPFFGRLEVSITHDIGLYAAGEGKKVLQALETDPKYAKFKAYNAALKERESFKKTFKEKVIIEAFKARFSRS